MEEELEQGHHQLDDVLGVLHEALLQLTRVAHQHLARRRLLFQAAGLDPETLLRIHDSKEGDEKGKTVSARYWVFVSRLTAQSSRAGHNEHLNPNLIVMIRVAYRESKCFSRNENKRELPTYSYFTHKKSNCNPFV